MRRLMHWVAVALATFAFAAPFARAEDYPTRPVRIMVGFAPGSSADITARTLAQRISQILGQQFVVEIKPGAASGVAAEFTARAPKDGYTLFMALSANLSNQAINPNVSFDMVKDFAPIALATSVPIMLVVHPSSGVNSLQDLVAMAKSKPGEVLTPPPASAPPRTSPANCSHNAPASSSCTCRIRAARKPRPICWLAASP